MKPRSWLGRVIARLDRRDPAQAATLQRWWRELRMPDLAELDFVDVVARTAPGVQLLLDANDSDGGQII